MNIISNLNERLTIVEGGVCHGAEEYGAAEQTSIDITMSLHWSDDTTDIWLNSKSDRNPSSPTFKTGSVEWDISQKAK